MKDRLKADYKNNSSNFVISSDDTTQDGFRKQFFFLYRVRLNFLTVRIVENAKKILGDDVSVTQLADVSRTSNDTFVVGIILKRMKFRRTVLNDFTEEETLDFEYREKMRDSCLVSDEDILEFEADQQVVKLTGNIDKNHFVTGTVIGIYGHMSADEFFYVKQIIFPTLALQIPWPIVEKDCFVGFVSGIAMTGKPADNLNAAYALEKLANWICAEMPLSEQELNIIRNIARLVIAGDSVRISKKDDNDQKIEILASDYTVDKDAIGQFDKLLSRLVTTLPVDLMSGPNDPTTLLLPQQPIPRVVFPWARRFGKLLNTVTNPYKFTVNGISFLGTSGQNITDLLRLTLGQPPLELMEECLIRGHIFPTVPDSVDGFPFQQRDPFILEEMPHVFFAGNQNHLEQAWMDHNSYREHFTKPDADTKMDTSTNGKVDNKIVEKTMLLTIPDFKRTQMLTLLNLRNMRVIEYDFSQNENLNCYP